MKAFAGTLLAATALLTATMRGQSPAAPPHATAQKVIDDYVRAAGGAKALAQIQTETIAGNLSEESTGKTGTYSRIVKAPNRFYSEIIMDPDRDIDAYNGMSAWGQDSAGSAHTLTGEAAKDAEAEAQYWNSHLADVKKAKLAVEWIGIEPVRGRDAYHIQVLLGARAPREVFFDAETHLIVRDANASDQFDYDDYRPVKGIQIPYQIEVHKGGHDYKLSVTRAEINSPVADSVFDFPRESEVPLPDMKALFLELTKNQKDVEELRKQYTYHLTSEGEEVDSKGQTKSKTTREMEIFHISGGGQVGHLIAKDGKPLEGAEKKKEDERFNKVYEERTRERAKKEAEKAKDPEKQAKAQAKEDAENEADISSFLRAERFTNPRRERFRGQEVLAFDFGANPDYKAKSIDEHMAQSMAGVILIDEQAHEVVRMEARFSEAFKVAGGIVANLEKGSNMVFEQTKVNDEVWLPSYSEIHVAGRFLVMKLKANQIARFSDYKKFTADSKLTIEQQ
jgi:hypothetical protein